MEKSTVLIILSLFTLLAGMAVAAYQLWAAEKAKAPDNPTKSPLVTGSSKVTGS